jgi:hypothetical protein
MVDVFDLDDVLERVLTRGVVIETDERPSEGPESDERAAALPSIAIMGLKVLKLTDD